MVWELVRAADRGTVHAPFGERRGVFLVVPERSRARPRAYRVSVPVARRQARASVTARLLRAGDEKAGLRATCTCWVGRWRRGLQAKLQTEGVHMLYHGRQPAREPARVGLDLSVSARLGDPAVVEVDVLPAQLLHAVGVHRVRN